MAEVGALRVTLGLNSIDFTNGVQEVNRRLRALDSEFRALTAGAGRFDNSLDALRGRSDVLTRSLQTHRAKVEELRRQYEQSARTKGEDAAETQNLLIRYNQAVAAMNRTEHQLRQVNSQIQTQTSEWGQLRTRVDGAVDTINRQLRVLDSEFRAATAGINNFGSETSELRTRSDHLGRTLNLQRERVNQLEQAYREAVRVMGQDARETQDLQIQYNRATEAMRRTESQLRQTNDQIREQSSRWNRLQNSLNGFSQRMQDVGNRMQSAGSEIATTFGVAFGAVAGTLGVVAKKAMDFESQISSVKSVMSPEEVNKFGGSLEQLAITMGAKTKFSALEAAQGIEELIKAGVAVTDIINGGLEGALTLAVAGELELADAAEIASTALNAFKKDNLSVAQAADILAGAANASATSVSEMKFGLSMVSAVASGVGMNFKDTSTALAMFAQNGLKGSDAGTSLKTMLLNLSPSTEGASTAMAELGLLTKEGNSIFYDSTGKLKSLADISEILKTKLSGLSDEQRQLAMKTMFGTDAIRAANILYNEGAAGITNMAAAMDKVKAADVAAEKLNNLKGRIELLKSSFETLAISLGNILIPMVEKFVAGAQRMLDGFNNLSPQAQKFIVVGGLVAAAITGITFALGGLLMFFGAVAASIGALTAPVVLAVGAITAGIAAFVAAGVALYKNWDEIIQKNPALIAVFAALNAPLVAIVGAIKAVQFAMSDSIPKADLFGKGVSEGTKKAVGGFMDLNDKATQQLNMLDWSAQNVTKKTATEIVATFDKMGDQIKQSLEKKNAQSLETITQHFAKSNALTEQEEAAIVEKMKAKHAEQAQTVDDGKKRIAEILNNAAAQSRSITDQERVEINRIQQQMVDDGIKTLSVSEREQKVILERLKTDSSNITARQAAEVVKNSKDQRDKTVKNAEDQYNKTRAEIIKQRDELKTITKEQADKLIDEARRQKTDTIKNAEIMHQSVVKEAKKQSKEHVNEVNWETGQILTKWQKFKVDVNTIFTNIGKLISLSWDKTTKYVGTQTGKIVGSVTNEFTRLKTSVTNKMDEARQGIQNAWNKAEAFLKGIDLKQIGKDVISGLIRGIGEKAADVGRKIQEIADSIPAGMKKLLGIRSPSRRMADEVGEHLPTGIAMGMRRTASAPSKEAAKIAAQTKKAFQDAFKNLELRYDAGKINMGAYIKELEKLKIQYASVPNAVAKIDKEIADIQKKNIKDIEAANKKSFNDAVKAIKDKRDLGKISAQQELALWESLQKKYKESSKERIAIDKQVYDLKFKLDKDTYESKKKLNQLSLVEEAKMLEEMSKKYKKGSDERKYFEEKAYETKKQIHEKLLKFHDEYAQKVKQVNDELVQGIAKLNEAYEKAVEDRTKSLYTFAGIFEEIKEKEGATGQQLLSNLDGQVKAFEDWSNNIQLLASRGINDGLLNELREMGPRAGTEIAALTTLSDSELAKYADLWQKKHELAKSQAVKELEGLKIETNKKIEELKVDSNKKLDEYKVEWQKKITDLRTGTEKEFDVMKSTLPGIGKNAMQGLLDGMDSMSGALSAKAKSIADSIKSTISSALDVSNYSSNIDISVAVGKVNDMARAAVGGYSTTNNNNSKTVSKSVTQNVTIVSPKSSSSDIARANEQMLRQAAYML